MFIYYLVKIIKTPNKTFNIKYTGIVIR